MNRLYFISDVHLGGHDPEREKLKTDRLVSFLEMVRHEGDGLVIVGDLFDFWFEYKTVVPRRHFRVLGQLALVASEIPVHYMAGNHDFWLDSFITEEIGVHIHRDDFEITSGSKKIYMRHGDGLLKNDYGYRFLKRILRNRMNIFLYRLIHPDIGVPFALFCSGRSRNAGEKRSSTYMDVDYREFAYEKIDQGYDLVILGHTHWAACEKYHNGYYINPGYWAYHSTFVTIENGSPRLLTWNGMEGVAWTPTIPPGNKQKKS